MRRGKGKERSLPPLSKQCRQCGYNLKDGWHQWCAHPRNPKGHLWRDNAVECPAIAATVARMKELTGEKDQVCAVD